MVASKQSCCRKTVSKRKTRKTAENTGKPEKPQEGVCVDPNNMLSIRLSTEARCFSLCKVKLNVVVCGASWATVRR